MKHFRSWAVAVLGAALLASCGGDDPYVPGSGQPSGAPTTKGTFTALVTFGDSLSDVGSYTPATSLSGNGQAPYLGGKFTVNATGNTIWVENVATTLQLVITPAEIGWGSASQKCPAAANPLLASTCTAYGQGGSRVTDPNGIGKTSGALTVPLRTQIANHLQRFGSFKSTDLIIVYAGDNDGFAQFGAFAARAAQIQADAAAGKLTADQASQALLFAETDALEGMKTAALELSDYVKSQILAKGGLYVAVLTPLDAADSPWGKSLPAAVRPVFTALIDNFNFWLREGLTGQPVKIIDVDSVLHDILANPSKYGLTNITVPACDADKIKAITGGAVTDGSSLFCNGTPGAPYNGVRTGADPSTWLFADGVHPTPAGHKIISDFVTQQLRAFGWIN